MKTFVSFQPKNQRESCYPKSLKISNNYGLSILDPKTLLKTIDALEREAEIGSRPARDKTPEKSRFVQRQVASAIPIRKNDKRLQAQQNGGGRATRAHHSQPKHSGGRKGGRREVRVVAWVGFFLLFVGIFFALAGTILTIIAEVDADHGLNRTNRDKFLLSDSTLENLGPLALLVGILTASIGLCLLCYVHRQHKRILQTIGEFRQQDLGCRRKTIVHRSDSAAAANLTSGGGRTSQVSKSQQTPPSWGKRRQNSHRLLSSFDVAKMDPINGRI